MCSILVVEQTVNLPLQEQHFRCQVMIKTPAWKMESWMEIAVLKRKE